ncbi:hypothetical protein KRR38_11745 [Novosphingobium sp. G106]|uniref:hypothetical protein n=1 Tax=Novosphingobium sp. G106 TaxID=2849500 RepID=UPI001C2CFB82|nr:hypothetical protein [Novosphingobium sp. G106]MBV1688330.1 hypothetical protein [Novosphingobium sp. G106]
MRVNKYLAAAVASAMISAPVMAKPAPSNPAAGLSLSSAAGVKAKTSPDKANKLGSEGYIIGGVVLVGILIAIIASDGDDSDSN